MTEPEGFSLKDRARSFRFAGRGLGALVREQHNARIHLFVAAGVAAAGFFFGVSRIERCALVLSIMAVFAAEALNTAIEHVADAAVPELHPLVGRAKDAAAGAVLLCAIGAALVGAIVFWPHLVRWIGA